ncbi:Anaphase spindle elongation protein 1 [Leucoagaricus sp. SymC.cos]|nr:Anaphase spindle elongation protein 1 [Leucoagaricus sp. SymC.cos]
MPGHNIEASKSRPLNLEILNVTIIGGGITGLAAAVTLAKAGHKVTIFEASDGKNVVGLSSPDSVLPPNGTLCLNRWGLGTSLDKYSQKFMKYSFIHTENDHQVGTLLLNEMLRHEAFLNHEVADYTFLQDHDLWNWLHNLARDSGVTFKPNSLVVNIDSAKSRITLKNGDQIVSDFIIGADGINGIARPVWLVWGGDGVQLQGQKGANTYTFTLGYRIPDDAVLDPSMRLFEWTDELMLGDLEFIDYKKFAGRPLKLVNLAKNTRAFMNVHVEQRPLENLVCNEGKVVLIGGASHGMVPAMQHNVALGLEDAEALGYLFSRIQSRLLISRFLTAFEEIRIPRIAHGVQVDASLRNSMAAPEGSMREQFDELFAKSAEKNITDESDEAPLILCSGTLDLWLYDASEKVEDWWSKWGSAPDFVESRDPSRHATAATMSAHETTTTLTDLLNSLHTHLQVQTQLLPTLHSQLGLPRSALEDDLKALHRELVQGVELQVERRRREVDEWMARCDEAENECIRYSRALGGNVKSTGATIGELRKEAVLPRRCELVTEHQEKLRQLYRAKLEQLTTITNRIHSLARTLGPSFFSMDVLEPCTADGENDLDPESYRDVTPDRFLKLEQELKRGKVELGNRLALLADIFLHIDWLYRELRLSPSTFGDLNSDSPSIISTACSSAPSPGSDPFLNTPTPHSRTNSLTTGSLRDDTHKSHDFEYQRVFAQFVARIALLGDQELPVNQGVPFGLEHVDPSPGLLAWAKELQASLEDIKRRRETYIQAMYDQLETLWWRFGINETEMSEFVEAHKGSTEEVTRKYEAELERMLEMKREHMGAFIDGARQEIVQLWDDLMIGEDEKAEFAPFVDDEYTEELLAIHEEEIRRLKEDRRLKAPLLATVRKYFDICEEAKELALAAADQTRLLGRGPRDPGRLLREEKTRKRVSKEKPRLERDLLSSIPAWEEETGRPFLVNGESFLPMLMEAVAASDQENRRRPPRAGSVPPRATTPTSKENTSNTAQVEVTLNTGPKIWDAAPSLGSW